MSRKNASRRKAGRCILTSPLLSEGLETLRHSYKQALSLFLLCTPPGFRSGVLQQWHLELSNSASLVGTALLCCRVSAWRETFWLLSQQVRRSSTFQHSAGRLLRCEIQTHRFGSIMWALLSQAPDKREGGLAGKAMVEFVLAPCKQISTWSFGWRPKWKKKMSGNNLLSALELN